jgi:hypothetical protein
MSTASRAPAAQPAFLPPGPPADQWNPLADEQLLDGPSNNLTTSDAEIEEANEESMPSTAELTVMADRVKKMTWHQFGAIRDEAIARGLPAHVATNLAWLAADPTKVLTALKAPDSEILGKVLCETISVATMTAAVFRAPENVRMEQERYDSDFALSRYVSSDDNSSLVFSHTGPSDAEATADFYAQMAKIDRHVESVNSYRADIVTNGIRVGGTLFPLMVKVKGVATFGAFETADCYGRVLFAQQGAAEAVGRAPERTLQDTISVLTNTPTTGVEFGGHPMKKARDRFLAVAGKVREGKDITRDEARVLTTAVMPSTRIVLSVRGDVPLDEVRRRFVAQQHMEPPTPFTVSTERQARGVAVLTVLESKGRLPRVPGTPQNVISEILNNPKAAIAAGVAHPDDVAVLAAAALLPTQNTVNWRLTRDALETRGVITKNHTRSLVAAEVATRAVASTDRKQGRQSSLERALRLAGLRGVCPRSIGGDAAELQHLLDEALGEFELADEARARGERTSMGAAMKELAVRAAYWATCAPNRPIIFDRTAVGSKGEGAQAGDMLEPNQVLERLLRSTWGIQQLTQIIADGRRGIEAREVPQHGLSSVGIESAVAAGRDVEAEDQPSAVLTPQTIRRRAGQPSSPRDQSASARMAAFSERLHTLVQQVATTVSDMAKIADKGAEPYVNLNGWPDRLETLDVLGEPYEDLIYWKKFADRRAKANAALAESNVGGVAE